jgi:hypothetical protein
MGPWCSSFNFLCCWFFSVPSAQCCLCLWIVPSVLIVKYTSSWAEFELTTLAVVDTDCKYSCKSNYHTIKNTTPKPDLIFFSIAFYLKIMHEVWFTKYYATCVHTIIIFSKSNTLNKDILQIIKSNRKENKVRFRIMLLNISFNNILDISWRSV